MKVVCSCCELAPKPIDWAARAETTERNARRDCGKGKHWLGLKSGSDAAYDVLLGLVRFRQGGRMRDHGGTFRTSRNGKAVRVGIGDRGRVGLLVDTFHVVLDEATDHRALIAWLNFGVRIGIVPTYEELVNGG